MAIDWAEILSQWSEEEDFEDVQDDLSDFMPVDSSNLAAVKYNANEYVLMIAFLDGSVYRYEGVPREEFFGLMRADSHGEYFVDNIRLIYPFERIIG